MGLVQKDALKTTILSFMGLGLGYLNKAVLFILFLSTEQIGLINLVLAVGVLFARLCNLGVVNTIWRFFPFFRNNEKQNNGFLPFILSIIAAGILIYSICLVLFKDFILQFYSEKSVEFVEYYWWIIPIGIANILFFVFETYLRSLYKNVFVVFANEVLYRLFVTINLIAFGFDFIDFDQMITVFFLLSFIPPVLVIIYTHKIGELYLKRKYINIKSKFKKMMVEYSLFGYLNTIGASLVISIDTLMVASMLGLKETGVYSTIIYLTAALSIPYRSISRVSAPLVSDYWKKRDMKSLQDLYRNVTSVSIFIGLFSFAIIWINRVEIFNLLPKDFSMGINVFLFLMIGRLFDFYGGLNGLILVSSKKYKVDIFFTSFLLISIAVLNYYLIPIYGINGAAISTAAALIGYNMLRMLYIYKQYKIHPILKNHFWVLLVFAANLFLYEVLLQFNFGIPGAVLKCILFGITFLGPIYFFKIEPNSVDYVNKILMKIKLIKK